MNILVTGSNGFLGKHITAQFRNDHVDTINRSTGTIHADLKDTVPALNLAYDIVIHCAGKAHSVPKTEEEKQEFFAVNVQGTKNLLTGLSNSGSMPAAFVFISTVAVYGLTEGIDIDETTKLLASDPYGISKIEAETVVKDWCEKNNVICTILRLPLIAGANPPGNLGAMIRGIKGGYYFNIGSGEARKSIVLASDVAAIIPEVARIGGTYNLTDGSPLSMSEISVVIAAQLNKSNPKQLPPLLGKVLGLTGDILGKKFPINTDKLRKMSSNLIFSDKKARATIGWKPNLVKDKFRIV